jgi:hypothetical protein
MLDFQRLADTKDRLDRRVIFPTFFCILGVFEDGMVGVEDV